MLKIVRSTQFKRDAKRLFATGRYSIDELEKVLQLLVTQTPLPLHYQDHPLKGLWRGYREFHIQPDWLLIYQQDAVAVRLVRMGSHSDLFG